MGKAVTMDEYNKGFKAGYKAATYWRERPKPARKVRAPKPRELRPPLSADITPTIVKRGCGGYLATSPPGSPLKIGVTEETEAETREKFAIEIARWVELLAPAPQEPAHD